MNKNVKGIALNLVYSGMLIAIGVLLPQLFHIFGATAGRTFLPMHIPVLLAGFLVGPAYGLGVAIIVPILSSLFTGMPAVPMLYFMLFELAVYAIAAGLMYKKFHINAYISLIVAMICGRLAYGLSLVVATAVFGMVFPFANWVAFISGITSGLPGIIIQIVIIPPIIYAMKKGGLALAKRRAG